MGLKQSLPDTPDRGAWGRWETGPKCGLSLVTDKGREQRISLRLNHCGPWKHTYRQDRRLSQKAQKTQVSLWDQNLLFGININKMNALVS